MAPYVRRALGSRAHPTRGVRKVVRSRKVAGRARVPRRVSVPLKTVKTIAKRSAAVAVDKAIPDTVISVFKTTTHNSAVTSADVGYLFKDCGTPNVPALALVRRIAAITGAAFSIPAGRAVGLGVRCKSVRYRGSFHINPDVFADNAIIQNSGVIVHCWILKDKYNKEGNYTSDGNCVFDLLKASHVLWPDNGGAPYRPDLVDAQLNGYNGLMTDESLSVNRDRFTVVHHKKWVINPTSAVTTAVDVDPFTNVTGKLFHEFSFNIPCPKLLKWDRRSLDLPCSDGGAQTPNNVGDPFVIWGYTTIPNGPDVIAQNLVVNAYTDARLELLPNAAA